MLKKIIDLKQVITNIININKDVIIVIKSDAYEVGAIEIINYIEANKQDTNIIYAVVNVNEAKQLIEANIKESILVLNSIDYDDLDFIEENDNIIISINNYNDAMLIYQNCIKQSLRMHLQIETGMNRLGIKDIDECKEILSLLRSDGFSIEGIYTHFTSIDNMKEQELKFKEFLKLGKFKYVHCGASKTYALTNLGNYARVGLETYGYNETNQAVSVLCKPIIVNTIKALQTIGYNETYKVNTNELIAVLPIGYNDGFRRTLSGYTLYANDNYYPVVGDVCMNHIFVKVDNSITTETTFHILSKKNTITKMAKYLNTVEHEILCMFKIDDKEYIK